MKQLPDLRAIDTTAFATWAAHWCSDTGANLRQLMARMGHATPQAALIYQHATAEPDRAIADALQMIEATLAATPDADDQGDEDERDPGSFWHVDGMETRARALGRRGPIGARSPAYLRRDSGSGGGDRTRNTQLQRLLFCRLNYPRQWPHRNARGRRSGHRLRVGPGWRGPPATLGVSGLMGSLIKKRRSGCARRSTRRC